MPCQWTSQIEESALTRPVAESITIPAGGYVVVGNTACADPSVTFPATDAIQNGAPDGVFIRDSGSLAVIDEIEYEAAAGPVCLTVSTIVGDNNSDANFSIQFCPGQGWAADVFSPCAANIACEPVSSDASSWGTLKSQF